jgi:enoyl-CoA hydratase
MVHTNISYEMKGSRIAKIIVNRPNVLNAIDYPTAIELKEILLDISNNPNIRIVEITGEGEKSFIVGADKQELEIIIKDEERAKAFEHVAREAINLLDALPIPVVCAINGHALGMGMQVALACTFRVVSSNARFGLPEINMGFFPSMGATQRLTRLVGEAKATEIILGGEIIDATEALRIGLVHNVIPQPEFRGFVEQFNRRLADKNSIAVRLAMDAIRRGKEMSLADGLEYEVTLSEKCLKKNSS